MKYKLDNKYKNLFLVGAGLLLVGVIVLNLPLLAKGLGAFFRVISPFVGGFTFAYILNRPVGLLEQFFIKTRFSRKPMVVRIAAVAVAVLILLLILAGLCSVILPQLIRNLLTLFERLPDYYQAISSFLEGFCSRLRLDGFSLSLPDFDAALRSGYEYLLSVSHRLADAGLGFVTDMVTSVTNLSIAVISGIYLLIFKDPLISGIKKALFAFFPQKPTERTIDLLRDSNRIFTGYLYSKLLTSVIVGGLTFFAMLVLSLPYSPLISVIMTLFNLIPFFGPFLGAVPSVLLLLLNDPRQALTFLLITLGVQFLDNQFLTPKIVGDSLGMNPFWVLFSIVVGGSIGGIGGMFFGVPLFAVLLAILRLIINHRLTEKGLSTKTADYHTPNVRK